MHLQIITSNPTDYATDCIVVGVMNNRILSTTAALLDKTSQHAINKILKDSNFTGQLEQSLMLYHLPNVKAKSVLLMGCGEKEKFKGPSYRKIMEKSIKILQEVGCQSALYGLSEFLSDSYWALRDGVESIEYALYRFTDYKTTLEAPTRLLKKITFYVPAKKVADAKLGLRHGEAIAAAVTYSRNISNQPGNVCTPSYLAAQAETLSKKNKRLKTTILDEKQMRKLNMGGILGVSQGSEQPAKLIIVEYNGAAKTQAPIVLVGKGITFDSGGISIKGAAAMDEMKYDMCGAAAILGVIKAAAELKLPLNIVILIAAAENLPSGSALKPGDIITTHSGKTVEILNTDAEGRLVLCDALSYCQQYKPEVVIDVATLTGAIIVALGMQVAGLFSNDEKLNQDLLAASAASDDRVWAMPLVEDYQAELNSNFADMANVGNTRYGGSIIAACYLARFTEQYRWAHLDIAGIAYKVASAKGATGRPVPLLMQYLLNRVGRH